MQTWSGTAGLKGYTLHGLRKTFGAWHADSEATTKQLQSAMDHTTLKQAELNTMEADREKASRTAIKKLGKMIAKK